MFSYSEALISLWIIFQIDYCCNVAFLFHLPTQHQYNFRDVTSSQHSCYAIHNNLWLLNNSFKEICTDLIWVYSHLLQEKAPHPPFIFSEKKKKSLTEKYSLTSFFPNIAWVWGMFLYYQTQLKWGICVVLTVMFWICSKIRRHDISIASDIYFSPNFCSFCYFDWR